jgi:hypothetical protein
MSLTTSTIGSSIYGPFDNHIFYKTLRMENPPQYSRQQKRFLNCCDSFFALFVIGPLVVIYWNGTWNLIFFKQFSPPLCFVCGAIIHCCFCLLRELLHSQLLDFKKHKSSVLKSVQVFFMRKFYTYLFSIGCIMHW